MKHYYIPGENAARETRRMMHMRLIIDISDEVFDEIYNKNYYSLKGKEALRVAVRGGTPLPKGHRWIPVSERLPEDSELVLFSTKTDRVFEGRYFADNTDRQWYAFRDECFAWNNVVTAWMPLPEPYQGGKEE